MIYTQFISKKKVWSTLSIIKNEIGLNLFLRKPKNTIGGKKWYAYSATMFPFIDDIIDYHSINVGRLCRPWFKNKNKKHSKCYAVLIIILTQKNLMVNTDFRTKIPSCFEELFLGGEPGTVYDLNSFQVDP